MSYSDLVLEHSANPRHVGELSDAHGYARQDNPICGDVIEMWVKLTRGENSAILEQAVFKAFGCLAVTAAASLLIDLVQGRALTEVRALRVEQLIEALGGLPPAKRHGAQLAWEALNEALDEAEASY